MAQVAGCLSAGRRWLTGIGHFYLDGFRSMRTGKTLWKIIVVKLIFFLLILKLFFPDILQTHFQTDRQRAAHVLDNLTGSVSVCSQGGE